MWIFFGVILGLCSVGLSREEGCESLEFPDPMLGTLKPCSWPKARGMLCMSDFPDVVVWPGAEESARLRACGFNRSDESQNHRLKRSMKIREKREDFNLEYRGADYNFKEILAELISMDFGRRGKVELDLDAELFINTKVRLDQNAQKGLYRAMMGPEEDFNPDRREAKALDSVLRLLAQRKASSNWDWFNLERITHELAICYSADYSTVTNQDASFNTPKQNKLLELGTEQTERSNLDYWYYKLSCIRSEGKVFLVTVVHTDTIRIADVEKLVDYWKNNPETVTKYVNEYRQRLLQSIESQTATDRTVQSKEDCHTEKSGWFFKKRRKRGGFLSRVGGFVGGLFTKERTTNCKTTTNEQQHVQVFNLTKQKILEEVTPQNFTYELNRWVKSTKKMMAASTLNLKERKTLKNWISNVVLHEIMRHFSQFFNSPDEINAITSAQKEEEESSSDEYFSND